MCMVAGKSVEVVMRGNDGGNRTGIKAKSESRWQGREWSRYFSWPTNIVSEDSPRDEKAERVHDTL